MQQVRGHVLFVLDMDLVNPQRLSKTYMHYALGISRAIQREDFALGAWVNLRLPSWFALMFKVVSRVQQRWSLVIGESLASARVLLPSK